MIPYLQVGALRLSTYTFCMSLGFVAGCLVLRANLKRVRRPDLHAAELTALFAVIGIAGARIYSASEHISLVLAHPWEYLLRHPSMGWLGGVIACLIAIPLV